jgi:polysaccharide pyruvyl transferase WcaK-like protein
MDNAGPKTSGSPLVTVALPVYNGERFLASSLDSLLRQDLADFELVISDNASTDRTGEICRDYASRDPRIRYLRQPRNIGAIANWNYLVHAARGRYFRWSSANDLCPPDMLSRCVAALEADTSLALCYGRTAFIDDDDREFEVYAHDCEFLDARPATRFRRACLEMRLNNAQSAVIRTAMLKRTGLERPIPESDMPLMAELALHGGFRLLPEKLFFRRMTPSSATRYMSEQQKASFRNPDKAQQVSFVVWPTTREHLRSIARAPMSWRERAECRLFVLRLLWWQRGAALREVRQRLAMRTPAPVQRQPVVALLGGYSSRNFGDTATQAAVIHNLRRLRPDLRLVGISHDAVDTLETHGIEGWNLQGGEGLPEDPRTELDMSLWKMLRRRWARWRRMRQVARAVDVLVISGSGQLEDFWGGAWGHAWALFAWALALRTRGRPVAVLATGLDDLSTRLGKWFVLRLLGMAAYRSFRDPGTVAGLRRIGFHGSARVCPDLAFSLDVGQDRVPAVPPGERVVVVCPISERAFRRSPPGVHQRYEENLLDVCTRLAARGYAIHISNSQVDMDGPLLEAFRASLIACGVDPARTRVALCATFQDYMALAAGADLVIASRLHAVILAIVVNTPVVAISYSRKVGQLMTDVGLEAYCVDLLGFEATRLEAMATEQLADVAACRRRMQATVAEFTARLRTEYEAVLELVPPEASRG